MSTIERKWYVPSGGGKSIRTCLNPRSSVPVQFNVFALHSEQELASPAQQQPALSGLLSFSVRVQNQPSGVSNQATQANQLACVAGVAALPGKNPGSEKDIGGTRTGGPTDRGPADPADENDRLVGDSALNLKSAATEGRGEHAFSRLETPRRLRRACRGSGDILRVGHRKGFAAR